MKHIHVILSSLHLLTKIGLLSDNVQRWQKKEWLFIIGSLQMSNNILQIRNEFVYLPLPKTRGNAITSTYERFLRRVPVALLLRVVVGLWRD